MIHNATAPSLFDKTSLSDKTVHKISFERWNLRQESGVLVSFHIHCLPKLLSSCLIKHQRATAALALKEKRIPPGEKKRVVIF